MRVAVLQLDMAWEDKPTNFQKVRRLLAPLSSVDLVCVPEMFATGFSMNVDAIAESDMGPTYFFLQEVARERHSCVVGTVVERGRSGGRNTALVFDREGNLLARYAKIHPFSFAGEDRHYEKGQKLPVIEMEGFFAAAPICYDLRFPELFRHATHRGATLFVVPANWPTKRVHHWRQLLIARAIENLAYVVGINRAGQANGMEYPGSSLIVAPTGEILAEAGSDEQVLQADLHPEAVADHRSHFRFLDDVRPDLFPDVFGNARVQGRSPSSGLPASARRPE